MTDLPQKRAPKAVASTDVCQPVTSLMLTSETPRIKFEEASSREESILEAWEERSIENHLSISKNPVACNLQQKSPTGAVIKEKLSRRNPVLSREDEAQ